MATVEVLVGVVGRAHGVHGEVSVELRTDEPAARFATGNLLRVENSHRTLTVAGFRPSGDRTLVRFAEVGNRTDAETLRGAGLVVDVDAHQSPEDTGEFYDRQLVGLAVLDADGLPRGEVVGVIHLPTQDLLEIATEAGVRLVPFVAALVPEVDLPGGRLHLADVGGLLHDDPAE